MVRVPLKFMPENGTCLFNKIKLDASEMFVKDI